MKILNKDLDDYVLGKVTGEKKKIIEHTLKGDNGMLRNKIAEINIVHFISNFLISKDIISITNHWKKNSPKDKNDTKVESEFLGKEKSFFTTRHKIILFALVTTFLLFIIIGSRLWTSQEEKRIDNESFAETIKNNQKDEPPKTSVPIYAVEDNNEMVSEKPEFKTKTKSGINKYTQMAIAMLPTAKFVRLRDDSKNLIGERVFKYYTLDDLKALLFIQNDFRNKGITNEYLDDLIGRLRIKRGEMDKALIIYTELSQLDSPNVDEYEFLLLLTYYADLPNSKYNFSQLQKYIAGDTLHTYFRQVKRMKIN